MVRQYWQLLIQSQFNPSVFKEIINMSGCTTYYKQTVALNIDI